MFEKTTRPRDMNQPGIDLPINEGATVLYLFMLKTWLYVQFYFTHTTIN